MAEQFLSRLKEIESSIAALGETLKRMITILGTITEVKSEVTQAKTEILSAVAKIPSETPAAAPTTIDTTQIQAMMQTELANLRTFVETSITALREEMSAAVQESVSAIEVPASTPAPAATPAAAPTEPTPASAPPMTTSSSLPADKAMQIAGHLDTILKSLKMGCKSGDVQDVMGSAKEAIMKIVPSDPIMIKIDKWVGLVASYPRRKELQARDILKVKKELKAEIDAYSPA